MTPSRMAAYLVVAVLFAAWLASAAGISRRPRAVVALRPSPQAVRVDALVADVQSQAARLRQRLATAPAPQAPIRNPFAFADRAAPSLRVQRPAERTPVPEIPAPAPPEPELALFGIAEQRTAAGLVITAIIGGAGDELFMVVPGQTLAGRYRVVHVGADAVELQDELTGVTRRLVLK